MINLSTTPINGAITVREDMWIPIGHGLEVLLPVGYEDGDKYEISVEHFTTPIQVASTQFSDAVAISSPAQILSLIQDNLVISNNSTEDTIDYPDKPSQPIPNHRSGMLATFFNHIFLAKGRTLWWTDLDNAWNWYPSPDSEADFRMFEWEKNDITGICVINDVLFVHFPETIYSVEYIGKPTIVRILARVQGTGSISHRSIAVKQSAQYFLGTDNFYIWSVQTGLAPIGSEIWSKFLSTCTDLQSVWAYSDPINDEICWVSGSTIWAFNTSEKHWTKYSNNSFLSHTVVPWYPTHQLISPTNTETLSRTDKVQPIGAENLWLYAEGVCREQRYGMVDGLSKCLSYEMPFVETDEITYGDVHFVKTTDLVVLDASYEFPWRGVKVSVCGKHFVSEKSVWTECGEWKQFNRFRQIDFKGVSGRVLKYRFEVVSDLSVQPVFYNGAFKLDGRRDDVFSGLEVMSGEKEFCGRQFDSVTGLSVVEDRFNWFELAAWGERVDMPQIVIGPDK